ncbi:uncharacterized protein LOC111386182 [Olea europaea var. sylvestris]|uniref:uncharacterized protein LOC111386182 n=1 Tax=Olea europaea var. sylvestris TaxID=158386 RepID=UPI000C1D4D12|nr:uncharacterized protein LOC111386182 [Olea europaea var. sylvestris]
MVIIPPSSYSTAPRKKLPLPNLKDVAKISPSSPSSSPSSTTSGTAPLLGHSPQHSAPKMNKKPSKMRKWLRKIHMPKILKGFNVIKMTPPTNNNSGCNLPPIAPLVCPLYIP